jgi:aspergillopepsin I
MAIVTPTPQTTFFDTVKSNLDKPLFAVTLKHQAPGSYDFGFVDVQKHTGQIAYTPVDNSQGFWGFTASGYSIGGSNSSSKFAGGRHIAPRSSIDGIAGKYSLRAQSCLAHILTEFPRHWHYSPAPP